MHFLELTKQILREMYARKMRSVLALFGIVWGTVAVVLLLAIGQGFYTASKNNMRGFVDGTLLFNPGMTSKPFDGMPPGQRIAIKASDVITIKKYFPQIKAISPMLFKQANISVGKRYLNASIQGVGADYAWISKKEPAPGGRFIDKYDITQNRTVIYLGPEVKQSLFPHGNPLGKQVYVNGIPFTVIGVLPTLSNTGKWYGNTVMIPYTTSIALWGNQNVSSFVVLPKNIAKASALQQKITNTLSGKFHFDPHDKSALYVFNMSQVFEFFKWFFLAIEIFLGFCGAMTLGVGGVGVANVMFLIVTERTHEIGLRMAIGARTSHIMLQILMEALVIVLLGGLIGFLISGVGIYAAGFMNLPHWLGTPHFSFSVLVVTITILTMTALLAGYFPARRAAKMEPVTALAF